MKPGFYTATLKDWMVRFLGADEKPCVECHFTVTSEEGESVSVRWRGWLTEKGKKYAIKDLITMGFTDKDLVRFAKGTEGGALDASKHYRVKLVAEDYKGKTYYSVRSIYPAKSEKEQEFDRLARLGEIKAIDIAGEVLAHRGTTSAVAALSTVSGGNEHDLPF